MKDTLLIVEDSLQYLLAAHNALSNKFNLLFAMSLSKAMELLEKHAVDGVITDICFHEKGVTYTSSVIPKENRWMWKTEAVFETKRLWPWFWKVKTYQLPDRQIKVNNHILDVLRIHLKEEGFPSSIIDTFLEEIPSGIAWQKIGDRGIQVEVQGETSMELRDQIVSACSRPSEEIEYGRGGLIPEEKRTADDWEEMFKTKIRCFSELQYEVEDANSLHPDRYNEKIVLPANGYFVIEHCVDNGIPITFLSSRTHAPHTLPVPVAAGVLTIDQFLQAFKESSWEKDFQSDLETPKGFFVGSGKNQPQIWMMCAEKLGLTT
ncbi:MAG: hypothetical protein WD000_08225 [Thermodesulfobacteriota bacterium]